MSLWVVRAGINSEIVNQVKKKGLIAIGWSEMKDCSSCQTREEFRAAYLRAYPDDASPVRQGVQSGQVFRFAREMKVGDLVMTPNSPTREMMIDEVSGEYKYDPAAISPQYPNLRPVKWLKTISRDQMTAPLRAATGGIMAVFRLDPFEEEVRAILGDEKPPKVGETEDFYGDTRAKADELISDLIAKIGPYEFEELVAALLRAMGFRTSLTRRGPDRGVDVIAHPDALGFGDPRIKVQVKHHKGQVGAPDVRNFRATLGPTDKGLFVSTGGFSAEAQREPDRAGQPLTFLDRDRFVDLLTEYYDSLEPEYKAMVPLRKVYVPGRVE